MASLIRPRKGEVSTDLILKRVTVIIRNPGCTVLLVVGVEVIEKLSHHFGSRRVSRLAISIADEEGHV
jgi:hypothetical protein